MADALKKHELSGEYYNHKRASLLASAIFLALSLPNIDLSSFNFVGIKLVDRTHVLVPVFAGAIAAYYLVHYYFVWRTEAVRYARSEAAESNPTFEALSAAAIRLQDMVNGAKQELDRIPGALAAITPAIDGQAHAELWQVADDIQSTDTVREIARRCADQALTEYLLMADGTGQVRLRQDLVPPGDRILHTEPLLGIRNALTHLFTESITAGRRTLVHRALIAMKERRADLFLLVGPAHYAAELVRQQLPTALDRLGKAQRDVNKARRVFQVDQRAIWFRTSLLDLWVPVGLFAAAVGLFVTTHLT